MSNSVLWCEVMKISMQIALRQLFAHFLPRKCKCVSSMMRDYEPWHAHITVWMKPRQRNRDAAGSRGIGTDNTMKVEVRGAVSSS